MWQGGKQACGKTVLICLTISPLWLIYSECFKDAYICSAQHLCIPQSLGPLETRVNLPQFLVGPLLSTCTHVANYNLQTLVTNGAPSSKTTGCASSLLWPKFPPLWTRSLSTDQVSDDVACLWVGTGRQAGSVRALTKNTCDCDSVLSK